MPTKRAPKTTSSTANRFVKHKSKWVLVLVLSALGFWFWRAEIQEHPIQTKQIEHKTSTAAFSIFDTLPPAAGGQKKSEPQTGDEANPKKNLEQVSKQYCQYKSATQYPNNSRPIAEHPDQIYPNQAIEEHHAMRNRNGGSNRDYQITTTQSRVYLAAQESLVFSLRASDQTQQIQTINIERVLAHGLNFGTAKPAPEIALRMQDDGQLGDQVAADGLYTSVFSPAQTSFAQFAGTIRIEVQYRVQGQAGQVFFDVIYSPTVPAIWNGKIRENIEQGALVFHLPMTVQQAGRYIVNGRVDDAQGKPFAFLNFNGLLSQGNQDVILSVAGKLLRDQTPSFPLSLRDIDGYLLKEDVDPDRALIPRLVGLAHLSKSYSLKQFSDQEWDSEERQRYLSEFSKDVALARKALGEQAPELARSLPENICDWVR